MSDSGTETAPIRDNWSTRLFGGPIGKSIEDARSTADQSNNHSSLWSYLLHYRETSRNQVGRCRLFDICCGDNDGSMTDHSHMVVHGSLMLLAVLLMAYLSMGCNSKEAPQC